MKLICMLFMIVASNAALAQVKDAQRAAAQDVKDATSFLGSLPEACKDSHAYASKDGRVTVKMICNGESRGLIVLKGGKVIDVR